MLTQLLVEYLKQLLFGYGQFNNILQTQVWVFALEHNQHFKQGWEEVLNAFRFGNVALKENHLVRVFLVSKGVEAEDIKSERFTVKEQLQSFVENKGELLACGTCMKARQKEESNFCPVATMKDLLEIVEWSDRLLAFG
jgi:uncharacterized protein involved in oxidation of intracellular sulfur